MYYCLKVLLKDFFLTILRVELGRHTHLSSPLPTNSLPSLSETVKASNCVITPEEFMSLLPLLHNQTTYHHGHYRALSGPNMEISGKAL